MIFYIFLSVFSASGMLFHARYWFFSCFHWCCLCLRPQCESDFANYCARLLSSKVALAFNFQLFQGLLILRLHFQVNLHTLSFFSPMTPCGTSFWVLYWRIWLAWVVFLLAWCFPRVKNWMRFALCAAQSEHFDAGPYLHGLLGALFQILTYDCRHS